MFPSWSQIEKAAYDRWERRGRIHGHDREDWLAAELDLTFDANFQRLVEYSLAEEADRLLGSGRIARCRFCEQSAPRATFGRVRPVAPEVVGNRSLKSRDLCDECGEQFARGIHKDLAAFWQSLEPLRRVDGPLHDSRIPSAISIGAYKALIQIAISIMPEHELAGMTDTIEWVSNPDQDFDSHLFGGLACLAYQVHVPFAAGWAALARRVGEEAPFPYMLFFLASERLILQAHLPLCSHDDDLDGTGLRQPARSFTTGRGSDLRASMCLALPIRSSEPPRQRRIRLFA